MSRNWELDDADEIVLARRNQAVVTKAILARKQNQTAGALNVAAPTLSDYLDANLERFSKVLAAAGCKVVLKGERTYPLRRIAAWRELARDSLDNDGVEDGAVLIDE